MTLTFDKLIQAIEDSKRTMTVCAPSTDFYARRGDWSEEYIDYIDANELLERLKEMKNA